MPGRTRDPRADGEAALREAALRRTATALLRRHGGAILRYLSALLHDREAAREAYGAFEEDLWRGLPGFRGECSRKTWAFRLAWHAALRYLRDPYQRRRVPLDQGAGVAAPPGGESQSGERGEERARAVQALRESLRPEEQTLLTLRVNQKLSWHEVSAVLARPGERPPDPGALRKRFERLKAKLAKRAREAGALSDFLPGPARH